MTTPPDHISFDLLPNGDDDDPKNLAAIKAAIIAWAKIQGISLDEAPGAIEPDVKENPERAATIRETTNPQLIEATAAFRREEIVEESQTPAGTIKRRVHRIVEGRAKLAMSLESLQEIVDKCTYGIGKASSVACEVVNWIREKLPSRRR